MSRAVEVVQLCLGTYPGRWSAETVALASKLEDHEMDDETVRNFPEIMDRMEDEVRAAHDSVRQMLAARQIRSA